MRKCINGVYSDMTPKEVACAEEISRENEILELSEQLSQTDYKAIKFAEGEISKEDYAAIKAERQRLRERIRLLRKPKEESHVKAV